VLSLRGEEAQDTLEYVITIGVVVVAMFVVLHGFSLFPGMPGIVNMGVNAMCSSIDTAPPPTPTSCVVAGP
jgi:hypothetical protein